MFDRLAAVHELHNPGLSMVGTTAIGRVRPPSEPPSGKRAGRYVLGDLLGRGGMAEVFAGHSMGDHGFQKPVAIKRLLPELANDTVFVERLISEAKLLVGMQHGNIVSVLDLARDGEDVFLVMEFVDGPSLRQLLKACGQRGLSLGVASYIVQAAAAGLEFAHARPGGAIIHADISPSNLLLTTSGEVRVADFGIARREGGAHGIVEGKWAYMAPEQARGEPLTPRSDVFALGVVLYELITGSHPFGRQVTADEREYEQMKVIPPRVVRPSVPPGLDAICMRALAHDPRERYGRMQHVIDAILDERFANQWREGASDLAHTICAIAPQHPDLPSPRTMVTDRPLTIVTRSLIELTPARRSSARLPQPVPRHTPMPATEVTAAPRDAVDEAPSLAPAAPPLPPAVFELPPQLRLEGAPMPTFRLSEAVLPGQDLASVHGGTMANAAPRMAMVESPRSNRVAFLVLAIAAVVGAIAAVVLQIGPREIPQAEASPLAIAQPVAPTPRAAASRLSAAITDAPPVAVQAVAAPTITPEPAPAPAPAPETETESSSPATPVRTRRPEPRSAPAARKQPAARKEPGTLRTSVGSDTWAWVVVSGRARIDAQGASFSLPPGRHTVKFYNDETGASKTGSVTIESNKVTRIKVNLDENTIVELP